MTARKPKAPLPRDMTPNQAAIALDILKKWEMQHCRYTLYSNMARRKDGQDKVRFVDQESRREVLDVSASDLARNAELEMEKLNAELVQFCGMRIVR